MEFTGKTLKMQVSLPRITRMDTNVLVRCYYSCKFVKLMADISFPGMPATRSYVPDSPEDFIIYHMHQVPHEELLLRPFQSPPVDL